MRLLVAAVVFAAACATATPMQTSAPATSCGDMTAAVIQPGTEVYGAPDGTSDLVATLKAATPACASSDVQGFGYRHVKLADGRAGYVSEESIQ